MTQIKVPIINDEGVIKPLTTFDWTEWEEQDNEALITLSTQQVEKLTVSRNKIRKQLRVEGLFDAVQNMVDKSGDVDIQDSWDTAPNFFYFSPSVQTLIGGIKKNINPKFDGLDFFEKAQNLVI